MERLSIDGFTTWLQKKRNSFPTTFHFFFSFLYSTKYYELDYSGHEIHAVLYMQFSLEVEENRTLNIISTLIFQ